MAKRSISLSGILHSTNQLEEVNKKSETYELHDIQDVLSEFRGKTVSITIREVSPVESVMNAEDFAGDDPDE